MTAFALSAFTGFCFPEMESTGPAFHRMQSGDTEPSYISWRTEFVKGHPVKRSGSLFLPVAWYEKNFLYIESKIDRQLPYSIVSGNETIGEGIMNLKKDEQAVIPVEDLEPGEYQIRITINENVYSGEFYINSYI